METGSIAERNRVQGKTSDVYAQKETEERKEEMKEEMKEFSHFVLNVHHLFILRVEVQALVSLGCS